MPGLRQSHAVSAAAALSLLSLTLAACGGSAPIVDERGIDPGRYQQDLKECQAYTSQVSTSAAAGKSAAGGAAVGAVIGAIVGNTSTVIQSAGIGGVLGGARGAVGGENQKDQVVRNCLRGRGYNVLN